LLENHQPNIALHKKPTHMYKQNTTTRKIHKLEAKHTQNNTFDGDEISSALVGNGLG